MNIHDLRSSVSSYGDPRYASTASFGVPPPPAGKVLVDRYRDTLDPQNEGKPQYNALNPAHPRSSALLNANDPVAMYLLTETAIGDSLNYEILSLEEVEELKKEQTVLSGRIDATKRKLALETKLRDAAKSLSRLYNPNTPPASEEFNAGGSPKSHRSSRRSMFGRNGAADTLDKTDGELAVSERKCEALAEELWKLERRGQNIQQRLLQHTAGVLQMTHKGLKKNPKNTSSAVVNGDGHPHEFDDRSLYKTPDHLDEFGYDKGSASRAMDVEAIQTTERKLEALSERIREMILQNNADDDFGPVPEPSHAGGPINPTAAVEAHLHYIENGLGVLGPRHTAPAGAVGQDPGTAQHLSDVNSRLHYIIGQTGLSRGPSLPPPNTTSDLQGQLSYLSAGVDGIESRVEGLVEQKGILTTQIQQQRELNSKSDAERDDHIAGLVEQIAHHRKQHELSEREVQTSRDELSSMMEQLEVVRQDSAKPQEASRDEAQTNEHAEKEFARLQSVIERLHSDADARAEEHAESRDRADQQVSQMEETMQQIRNDADTRVKDAGDRHAHAQSEVSRLEAAMEELRNDVESQLKEATDARAHAEENTVRLQAELTEIEGEVVRVQTELTMAKAELDGAYGSRSQRAADAGPNPAVQQELEALTTKNLELAEELAALKAGKPVNSHLQHRADTLEKELRETIDDYESMTKSSIEFEKERERFEGVIDSLRERCEQLETQLNEERINWMGLNSPTSMSRDSGSETTSTMVLKNEFKKMMRDTRAENIKILKAEREERVRLEGLLRTLKKEQANLSNIANTINNGKSNLSQSATP